MAATLTFNGRLPGVLCQSALPPSGEAPLRLDVAGFIGFAERGPVDTPVALEDISQYREVFGHDLLLARQGGQPVYAQLPQAVRAFFDNGGRRCYVVRVVGKSARPNRFRLPGIVAWRADTGLNSVVAEASWIGCWSDNVSVATQLRSSPLRVKEYRASGEGGAPEVDLETPTATTVQSGDLLRLRFGTPDAPVAFFPVNSVKQTGERAATTRGVPVTALAAAGTVVAFATRLNDPLPIPISVERLAEGSWELLPAPESALEQLPAVQGGGYALILPESSDVHPLDLLRVTCSGGPVVLFTVEMAGLEREEGSPPAARRVRLTTSELLWQVPEPSLSNDPTEADLLSFDLFIREMRGHTSSGDINSMEVWRELRFGAQKPSGVARKYNSVQHDNYWADVLTQDILDPSAGIAFVDSDKVGNGLLPLPSDRSRAQSVAAITRSLRLRAPAEAFAVDAPIYLPFGMGALPSPDEFAGPLPEVQTGSPPVPVPSKDGLDEFDPPALFLDPILRGTGSRDLLNEATQLLYLSNPPVRLQKLHALIPVEEVALIAAPDATQRAWQFEGPLPPEPTPTPTLPPPPDWSCFQNCLDADEVIRSFYRAFLSNDDAAARSYLTWEFQQELTTTVMRLMLGAPCAAPSAFDIHPSFDVDPPRYFGDVAVVKSTMHFGYAPDVTHWFTLVRRGESWAILCIDRVPMPQQPSSDLQKELSALPELLPPDAYKSNPLLEFQVALVNLCAARADAIAVLSLPNHFTARDALDWQQRLVAMPALLDGAELSYAAVYHPWLSAREEAMPELALLRNTPPDGAVCGMIAARELVRGAWIAPANVALRGVMGLTPKLTAYDWSDLFNAQVNVIRQQPGKFVALSAHTLSLNPLLIQLNVRRLLIYLRKLALRRGMRYVFESNNARFRQRVQGSFERALTRLLALGAVNAFQVVTDDSLNTPGDVENGRFIIALKVAPTLPIEFITIVLLRSGENLLQVLEI